MESNHRHSALQADALPLSYLGAKENFEKNDQNDQIHDIEYRALRYLSIVKI